MCQVTCELVHWNASLCWFHVACCFILLLPVYVCARQITANPSDHKFSEILFSFYQFVNPENLEIYDLGHLHSLHYCNSAFMFKCGKVM
jgi:hypothetical protein